MARSLLEHPSAPDFLREFQEEHLSELTFLLAQRQRYLHDPEVKWPDIESLEERIFCHSEAMQAGGDVAAACAREALTSEASDELTAGVFAIVLAENGIAEMMTRMAETDASLLPCFTEALTLVRHPQLSERLVALLSAARPEVRAATALILGHRHEIEAGPILPLLDDDVLEVRAAAALALSDLGHRPALPMIESRLTLSSVEELDIWALAALRLGSSRALHACRQAAQLTRNLSPRIPWLLGMAGDAQDFGLLRQLCPRPDLMQASLEALGTLGVPASIPLLIEHLSHNKTAIKEAAASALSLMTGAGLTEKVRLFEEDSESADGEEQAWREVTRPSLDATVWSTWWMEHRTRLEGKSRLRFGQPHSLDSCIEELAHPLSSFDARARAALEMDIRSGKTVGFRPDWPIRRQHQAIARWRRR
ncbi:HEAT repeat domain-containing protein [Cystobacter ferrugineus]|uniref:TIGR02270 family protein n=1 Tax=Cystobacter ferrugineus TaxID=83449 RepID=A0A1L9BIX9_9BACT|nr:HEAT repeat domain-containing protein [Cystobacter ferrugineus]OJH42242.1 hypothetical protein BON30_03255 [Cystobacter ferrugineus]